MLVGTRRHLGVATLTALAALTITATACNAILGSRELYLEETSNDGGTTEGAAVSDNDGTPPADAGPCGVDLSTSLQNCGACGHDCSNGKCSDGICTLVDEIAAPYSLAVRGSAVYVGLTGGLGGLTKCATNGCGSNGATRMSPIDQSINPLRIVVDDTNVYASDTNTDNAGGIVRAAIDGSGFARLAPDGGMPDTRAVAQDSKSIFFATDDAIYSCTKPACAGGIKLVTTTPENPTLIAAAGDGSLFWDQGNRIERCASAASCTAQEFPPFAGDVSDLVIDGNTVFWSTTKGQILSCSVTGCPLPAKVLSTPEMISAIAVQGTTLYWASILRNDAGDPDNDRGTIHTCTMPNCAATTRDLATLQHAPRAIVLDGPSLYWVNEGDQTVHGIGSIAKIPR